MSNEKTNLVRYVVTTSHFYWGIAETLEKALKNAHVNSIYALNSKKEDTHTAVVFRVEIDEVNGILTEEKRIRMERQGIDTQELEIGDWIEPWVNDFGGVGAFGEIEKVIKLKIK